MNIRDPDYLKLRSVHELRDLLFEGKVSVNDVRRVMALPPIPGSDHLESSLARTSFPNPIRGCGMRHFPRIQHAWRRMKLLLAEAAIVGMDESGHTGGYHHRLRDAAEAIREFREMYYPAPANEENAA